MSIEDNVVQFSSLVSRAMKAMAEYKAGVADETSGKVKAVRAVVEYGKALQEGRDRDRSNVAFKDWVHDNKLDVGDPWKDVRERSSAMKLATVFGTLPKTVFDVCPYTTPSNIMKWYRKMHAPADNAAGKSKKSEPEKAPETPQTDAAYEIIAEWKHQGVQIPAKKIFAKLIGISHATVEKAFDRWNREHAKEAKATATEDQALAKTEETFSEKSKLSVAEAIRIHKARLDKKFEAAVNAEVRRRIDAADEEMRKQNAELRKENRQLTMMLRQQACFTADDFKMLLMTAHPDNSASGNVRAAAFDLLRQNEKRLTGKN